MRIPVCPTPVSTSTKARQSAVGILFSAAKNTRRSIPSNRPQYKTAKGKTNWYPSTIQHILTNTFYCGTITYRKEWTPSYLEQKKILNIGDVPFEYAQGTHTPIVTREEFDKVQQILESHRTVNKDLPKDEYGRLIPTTEKRQRFFGKRNPVDVWCKLLVCECGSKFNRKNWHKDETGKAQHAYQCYSQKATGSIKTRENHGLTTEGVCRSPMVTEWQLQLMVDKLFNDYFGNGNKRRTRNMLGMLHERVEIEKHATKKENKQGDVSQIDKQIEKLKTM